MKLAWRAGYIDNSPSTKLLSFDDIHGLNHLVIVKK